MNISKGKIIKIRQNGQDVLSGYQPMTLNSEVTITLQSHFEPLIGDSTGKILTLFSGATHAIGLGSMTGKFKEMGFQTWVGTEPIQFSFDTTFNMKTNAKQDVLEPAQIIMKLPLPSQGRGIVNTKSKSASDFARQVSKSEIGLVAPGPSLFDALSINNPKVTNRFSIRIGSLYISSIVVESAEPTFSTDIDDQGYPIWCNLKIDCKSLFTATTNMIDEFGYVTEE